MELTVEVMLIASRLPTTLWCVGLTCWEYCSCSSCRGPTRTPSSSGMSWHVSFMMDFMNPTKILGAIRPISQAILRLVPFVMPPPRKLPGGMLEHLSGVNIWSNDLVPDILLTSVVGAVISILATIIPRVFFCMTPLANRVWVSRNSLACAQQIGDVWKRKHRVWA